MQSHKALAFCGVAAIALGAATSVQAQATGGDTAVEEVVVTGSRVITNGFAAPTPLTVVTAEQMKATAPTSLSDAVNQLPQFRQSFTPATTGFAATAGSGNGGSFANLRGLNPKRVLVLLDGQRVVQSQANGTIAGAVDLNILPQSLVKRVDVVTGGASAAYGSDALTGVLNFVLDTTFTGVKGEVRGGISQYGDNQNTDVSLGFGRAFAGDRGHFIASVEYFRNAGVKDYSARPFADGTATIANCAQPQTSLACPTRIIATPVVPSNMSSGGLIVGGATALRNQTFVGNGQLIPFPLGTLVNTSTMVGGGIDGNYGRYFNFIPNNMRRNGYVRVGYDLTPDWNVHADALYAESKSKFHGLPAYTGLTGAPYTIFSDNVYLPASVRALMSGPGATSARLVNPVTGAMDGPTLNTITIGKLNLDLPVQDSLALTSTLRFEAGIDGNIRGWKVSAYYTHGFAQNKNLTKNLILNTNLAAAIDAVASPGGAGLPAAGTPICRSTITNPGNGCVPLNVLGQGVASQAAIDYIRGPSGGSNSLTQKMKQDAFEFTVRGEPFSTWAGPVGVAVGAAYRREATVGNSDSVATSYNPATPGTTAFKAGLTPLLTVNGFPTNKQGTIGGWHYLNAGPSSGSLDVKEVFGEALVPLARDMPFFKQLDLNGAIRYADYQYGGGQTNWKIGLVYQPIEDIKFRATQSHDIRAPNLTDLFSGLNVALNGANDPFRLDANGRPEAANFGNTFSRGNPDLLPEVGDTTTFGVVFTPRFVPGLTASVDYYQILLTNAIQQAGGQTIVNQCFLGNQLFCGYITRNSDPASFGNNKVGPITSIFNAVLNVGTVKNAGLDIEVSYNLPLSRFFEGRNDSLTFRVLANYQGKNSAWVVGATSVTKSVGVVGGGIIQGTGGNVDWTGSLNVNYRNGPLSVNVQQRFINSGIIDATVDEAGNPNPANAVINPNASQNGRVPNTVPSVMYTDLAATFKFGPDQRYEVFGTINNLFNKYPPKALGSYFGAGVVPSNVAQYDLIGRNFTMGVRFRY